MLRFGLTLLSAALSVSALAALVPTDSFIFVSTSHQGENGSGFPAYASVFDSFSGFAASSLGSSPIHPVQWFSEFGPTGESPDSSAEGTLFFDLTANETILIDYGSTAGVRYWLQFEDPFGTALLTQSGTGSYSGSLSLDAGSYQLRYFTGLFIGSGHSTGNSTLTLASVPEPATLVALGAGALALLRRRKR